MSAEVGGIAIETPYKNVLLCEESIFGGLLEGSASVLADPGGDPTTAQAQDAAAELVLSAALMEHGALKGRKST